MALAPKAWLEEFAAVTPAPRAYEECGEYAVVTIEGPLEQHGGWECDSYDAIRARVSEALASSMPAVCLRINSPGGDFPGSIELARELKQAAAKAKKRLVAFTDSQALSAGYILACAAEEIVVTPSAFVGSIGVWAPLIDETQLDRAKGLNVVIVASGSRKVDQNPHVAITEDAVSAMQIQVDAMASMFFDLVQEARGMSLSAVAGLQGSSQFGTTATSLQLADRIVDSWGAFLTSPSKVAMAKSFGEVTNAYREALAKVAEGDDEDAKAAKAKLAAFEKEDAEAKAKEEGEEPKEEKKDDPAAQAADEDPEAKAEDEEKQAKAAARNGRPRLVASSTPAEVDIAKRVHALEVREQDAKDKETRTELLSGRPDFSAEVRKTLMSASIAQVRDAVKNWPRGSTPAAASTTATTPGGTRGATQGNPDEAPLKDRNGMPRGFIGKSEETFIEEAMNRGAKASAGVEHEGRTMVLGYMTPDEAKARLKALSDKGAAK